MQVMKALVVVMGVLIVAGVAVVVATIVSRSTHPVLHAAAMLLDEPAGTHIAGASLSGHDLAVTLQGGGPDRVTIIDLATGRTAAGVTLAH